MKSRRNKTLRSTSTETNASNRLLPSSSSSLFSLSSSGTSVIANLAVASSSLISSTVSPTVAVHPLKETLKSSTEVSKKSKDQQPVKLTAVADVESIVGATVSKKSSSKEVNKSASDSATNETTSASTTHTITTTKTAPALTGTSLTHITPIHGSGWETVTSGAICNASSSSLNTNFESSSLRSSSSLGGMLNARTSALANREFFLYGGGTTSSCETSPTSFNYPTYPHASHMSTFSKFKPNTICDSYTSGSSSGPSYRHASVDRLNSRRGIYDRNFTQSNSIFNNPHQPQHHQEHHLQERQSTHPLFTYSLHVPSIENVNNPINSIGSYGLPCIGHHHNKETFNVVSSETSGNKLNEARAVNCDFLSTRVDTSNESPVNGLKKGEEEEFCHKDQMKLHTVAAGQQQQQQPEAVNLLHQTKQQQGTHGKFKVTTVTVHPQGSIESSLPSSTSPPTVTLGVTKNTSSSPSTAASTTATAASAATATGNSFNAGNFVTTSLNNGQLFGSGNTGNTGPSTSFQSSCNGSHAPVALVAFATGDCGQVGGGNTNYCSNSINNSTTKDSINNKSQIVQPGPRMTTSAGQDNQVASLDESDVSQSNYTSQSIGFSLFPQQLYKKIIKKGFKFNLMVVGESGTGKSTAINSLFLTDIYSSEYPGPTARTCSNTLSIESTRVQLREGDVKIDLTIVDTPGFASSIDNSDCWKPMVNFIESKFEQFLAHEGQVHRSQVPDNRIHALLYFIAPTGHSLKQLDIEVMKRLCDKVNLIPVISKADAFTVDELARFRKSILNDLKVHGIKYFNSSNLNQARGSIESALCDRGQRGHGNGLSMLTSTTAPGDHHHQHHQHLRGVEDVASIPFALIGSNYVYENPATGERTRVRKYPWGTVQVEKTCHSDFLLLRNLLLKDHLLDLVNTTADVLYENYRISHLNGNSNNTNGLADGLTDKCSSFDKTVACNNQFVQKILAHTKMRMHNNLMAQLEKEKCEHEEHLSRMASEFESLLTLKLADRTRKLTAKKAELQKDQENLEKQLADLRLQFEVSRAAFNIEKDVHEANCTSTGVVGEKLVSDWL